MYDEAIDRGDRIEQLLREVHERQTAAQDPEPLNREDE